MTDDIARLGIAIDSSQAATAAKNLDALTKSAKPASTATSELERAAARFAKEAQQAAKSTKDNAAAHQGLSTQAMAAQHSIRSLFEGMASGQPISQALAQQINHLSYAATGPGGLTAAFKSATGSLLELVTPGVAVAGGLTAVAAAGLLAVSAVAKTELAFDDAECTEPPAESKFGRTAKAVVSRCRQVVMTRHLRPGLVTAWLGSSRMYLHELARSRYDTYVPGGRCR